MKREIIEMYILLMQDKYGMPVSSNNNRMPFFFGGGGVEFKSKWLLNT